jgi:ATP-dependent DNA helicase RecG
VAILDAERFGLAQLHQMRGRVGRGSRPGRCLLVTASRDPAQLARLDALRRTASGFEVAEVDLELRGCGEVFGDRQHGAVDLRFARLPRDVDLLARARAEVAAALSRGQALPTPRLREARAAGPG